MKKANRIALFFLATLLLSSVFFVCASAETPTEGVTFTADDHYRTKSALSALPSTYEATIFFPADTPADQPGGVILGNFKGTDAAFVSFEISTNGNPCLRVLVNNYEKYTVLFDRVNVYTGKWIHLAIVKDSAAGTVSCYIDGSLKQTVSAALPEELSFTRVTAIGGDLRYGNGNYFRGTIKNVALYSSVRSADEIAADSKGTLDTTNLMGFYELTENAKVFSDKNKKGPDFITTELIKDHAGVTDYAYSFAVIGDIQTLTYYYPDKLHCIYDWIVANKEEKKIEFVFGLGDVTDKSEEAEYLLAKSEIAKLDGVVPFSIIRGNHDNKYGFKKHFPLSEYAHTISGSYDDTMLNTYHELTIGEVKYLIINFDIGPDDDVLNWASKLIDERPDYNVILTTHVYLDQDGTTVDLGEAHNVTKYGGKNPGVMMWDKFVSKHKNIVLLLSGHIASDQIVVTKTDGVHGNTVTQILIDPQATDLDYRGMGLVAMFYFSEDGKQVDVEYYSTVKDVYFRPDNQFHLELDTATSERHTLKKIERREATCTEAGNIEHYICDQCGRMFEDAQATRAITDPGSIELAPLGHKAKAEWTVDETHHRQNCEICDIELSKDAHTDSNGDHVCDVCQYTDASILPILGIALGSVVLIAACVIIALRVMRKKKVNS